MEHNRPNFRNINSCLNCKFCYILNHDEADDDADCMICDYEKKFHETPLPVKYANDHRVTVFNVCDDWFLKPDDTKEQEQYEEDECNFDDDNCAW